MQGQPPPATKRRALAQVLLCKGCCCGRTERGFPEVPVERVKAVWQAEKLNRAVQLTISGCLGPCDLANVALVLTPHEAIWCAGLAGEADYDALVEWARVCRAAGALAPLPARLAARRFDRFAVAV